MFSTSDEYELIFDAVGKSAILRNEQDLIWLNGPFRTYQEAVEAARIRLEKHVSKPEDTSRLH